MVQGADAEKGRRMPFLKTPMCISNEGVEVQHTVEQAADENDGPVAMIEAARSSLPAVAFSIFEAGDRRNYDKYVF